MRQPDGSFVADARASLEDVIAAVGTGFDVGEAAKNVDTLGGYLVTQVGRVPGARRTGAGPGRLRVRSAGCRSAPGEEGQRSTAARIAEPQREQTAPARTGACATAGRPASAARRRAIAGHPAIRRDRAATVSITRVAHAVVLAWGWRRAADRFRGRRRLDAGACAVRSLAGAVPDLSGRWSG